MSKNTLVDVKNLSVHFPVHGGVFSNRVATVKAVDGINFSIDRKQIVGMVGESGCGKTTVGRAMINILRHVAPDVEIGGSIEYHFGDEIVDFASLSSSEVRKYRSRVQMIFQDPYASLNPRMTVAQIISEPLQLHTDMTNKEQAERVGWLLDKVGLQPEQARRYPHEFSGGQRQRVGIARALATNPDLIICDEPVSALDVSIQSQVLNLLQDLQEEFNLTYLFVAHNLSVIEHISDRVAVMYLGKIVELAPCDDLFIKPLHYYTQALMSAIPVADPEAKIERIILEGEVPTPINPPSGCRFHPRCTAATEKCKLEVPPLIEYRPEHWSACWHVEL